MRRWFAGLSIHRKLVAMALIITTVALLVAVTSLVIVDIVRFRADARAETASLARMLVENVGSAIVFEDIEAAEATLDSVRFRETVRRACLYLTDGSLFAALPRQPDLTCPARADGEAWSDGTDVVSSRLPITFRERVVGQVVVERDLSDLRARVVLTVTIGAVVLVLASALALVLANRLHRTISGPIADLARAARRLGHDDTYRMPAMEAPPDEVGELVRTFSDMVRRVSHSSATLTETNEALLREIDERRRMEAEREGLLERERRASRLKDEFLATVSHELRTPLNAILGWAQILRSTSPTPAVLERAIGSIDRNARAQTRLIEDLIDISRIVTGKLQLTVAPVDLHASVEAAVEVVRPAAVVKGVALHLDLVPGPCLVLGDGERLQQVFWNLLSNAVKFTPAGGDVFVSVAADDTAWVVRVRDTGIGIHAAFLPHIFERFLQADGSMTREHGGLGLGLAIARDLTQLHGGTITAESPGPGQGTEFTVRLAARMGAMPAAGGPASGDTEAVAPSLDGVRVLVVDDSADTLDVLRTALAAAGADVDVATSGDEALASWQRQQRDVLLCDLAMPQMDGYELLKRIRGIDAAAGRLTAAIAVTAHASEDQQARSIRAGFQRHVAKPCHPPDIVRAVAAVVER